MQPLWQWFGRIYYSWPPNFTSTTEYQQTETLDPLLHLQQRWTDISSRRHVQAVLVTNPGNDLVPHTVDKCGIFGKGNTVCLWPHSALDNMTGSHCYNAESRGQTRSRLQKTWNKHVVLEVRIGYILGLWRRLVAAVIGAHLGAVHAPFHYLCAAFMSISCL